MSAVSLDQAANLIRSGQSIAYPTEAVWGLGCDPTNAQAIERLVSLKGRPTDKGLILIAGAITQIESLVETLTPSQRTHLESVWPGFITYILPLPPQHPYPTVLTGHRSRIAVRVSHHPVVAALCERVGPLVSTSANPSGQPAARSVSALTHYFGHELPWVEGGLGDAPRPSRIVDLQTSAIVRE